MVGLPPQAGASEMDAYNKSFTGEKAGTTSAGAAGAMGGMGSPGGGGTGGAAPPQ
jgi:hypothetical protein